MAADTPERTGALVVRAWVEPGRDGTALRARITYSADLASTEQEDTVRVASDREQILGTVTEWLDELTAN